MQWGYDWEQEARDCKCVARGGQGKAINALPALDAYWVYLGETVTV